jgi:hypothetical protein
MVCPRPWDDFIISQNFLINRPVGRENKIPPRRAEGKGLRYLLMGGGLGLGAGFFYINRLLGKLEFLQIKALALPN